MKNHYAKYLGSSLLTFQVLCAGAASLTSPVSTPPPEWRNAAGDSHGPGITADGRWVVFVSTADNLVTNDNNGAMDVFVRDRTLGRTILVSIDSAGQASGNGSSHSAIISRDGRLVVFESTATNLVANDNNRLADVFVRELGTGLTRLVSSSPLYGVGNLESTSPGLTPDGRYVLFASRAPNLVLPDNNNGVDLFLRDLFYGTNAMVTRNYQNSGSQSLVSSVWGTRRELSDDGRFVAFSSVAPNLVRTDVNSLPDVFVRDLRLGTNLPVSLNLARTGMANGASGNVSMDASGRFCAFESLASNLAANDTNPISDVFWWDRATAACTLVSVNTSGRSSGLGSATSPVISRDGSVVVFLSTANDLTSGDTNSIGPDLFYRHLVDGQTTLIEPARTSGYFTVPLLSGNGRFVLFQNNAGDLVLLDAQNGSRTKIAAHTPVDDAAMTEDATFIACASAANASGLRDIFIYERLTQTTALLSVAHPDLARSTGFGGAKLTPGSLNTSGDLVVFESSTLDFDPAHTNLSRAAWFCDLRSLSNRPVRLNSFIPDTSRGPSRRPVISPSGRWIAFDAMPDSTPPGQLSNRFNLYALDRIAQTNLLVGGVGDPASPSLATFSVDGQALAFQSSASGVGGYATTLSQVYYRNLAEPANRLVSLNLGATAPGSSRSYDPAISPSGRYVAYVSSATNLTADTVSGFNVFLWDASSGSNRLATSFDTGNSSSPPSRLAFWADGTLLSFQRLRTNYLVATDTLTLAATFPDLTNITLSGDGRLLAGERWASYSPLDTNTIGDIYLLDRSTGSNSLVTVNPQGFAAGGSLPALSPDGRYLLFTSRTPALVNDDTNQLGDVFLRDLLLKRTILLSRNASGTAAGNRLSANPLWSPDGSTLLFESHASDLATGDFNAARDLFLLRLSHGDRDADGLSDDWELAFFNTLDRNGDGDFDRDGRTDLAEFLSGTDPSDTASVLQVLTCYLPASDTFRLIWSAVPGKTYRVQSKPSPSDPQWTDLPGDVLATDTTAMKDDPGITARATQNFYRVLLVP